jgi:hypothetical protein
MREGNAAAVKYRDLSDGSIIVFFKDEGMCRDAMAKVPK